MTFAICSHATFNPLSFQQKDCFCGVIVDGLESEFVPDMVKACRVVLQAFNNRKHIYVIDIKLKLETVLEREQQRLEAEGHNGMSWSCRPVCIMSLCIDLLTGV